MKIKPHYEIYARLDDIAIEPTEQNLIMMCNQTLEDMHEPGHLLNELKDENYAEWIEIKNSCQRIMKTKTAKKYSRNVLYDEWQEPEIIK